LSTNTSADSVNTSSTLSRFPSRDRPLRLDMLGVLGLGLETRAAAAAAAQAVSNRCSALLWF
jgi:hypothetical protein